MTNLLRSMRPIAAVFSGEATGTAWRLIWSFVVAVCLIGQAMAEPLEKTEIRYQGWAGQVTFTELLSTEPTLGWAVVTFIALLDLYRRSVIDLEQSELFADILVRRKQAA